MRPRSGSLIALLAACSTAGPAGNTLFLPALPAIAAHFGIPVPAAQATVSAYLIAFACGILASGPLADRFGRRPLILWGMSIFAIGSIIGLVASSLSWVVFARVVQGLGSAAGITVARATVGDLYEGPELARKIALLTMAMVLGTALSPYVGGELVARFGWQSGFAVLGIVGIVTVIACVKLLPETQATRATNVGIVDLWQQSKSVWLKPVFAGYVVQAGVIYSVFLVFIATAPYLMIDLLGRAPQDFGLFYLLLAGGYFLGNYYVSHAAHRVDAQRLVVAGLGAQVAGACAALLFAIAGIWHPFALFGPMCIATFGQGLALPVVTARAVSLAPGYAGIASSLIGFGQQAIAGVSVQAMGWAPTTSPVPVTAFCSIVGAIALGSALWLARHEPAPPQPA